MSKLKLEVGGKYLNSFNEPVEIVHIGEIKVLHKFLGKKRESAIEKTFCEIRWKPIPKKGKVIELFACLNGVGELVYVDKDGYAPYFDDMEMVPTNNIKNRKTPEGIFPSIFIDAKTFEIVRE